MHFTIIGAGAMGGTVGAYLVRAGHGVVFVDREAAHIEAINRDGLSIKGRETFTVSAPAVSPDDLRQVLGRRVPEAILLCVKAMDTEVALDPVVLLLGEGSFVVSLQNGLNERTIAARVGVERTVGAFINFGADYLDPGHVLYGGSGALYLGELDGRLSTRVLGLQEIFRSSFLSTTQATENIWGYLWGKLAYGSMLFATALVDAPIADVLEHPAYRPMLANLAAEVIRVAEAEGVRCEGFDGFEPLAFGLCHPRNWRGITESLDRLVRVTRQSLKQKSGVWRDLAVRHRRTEVDYQVGVVVDTARMYGLEVPLNQQLVALIHELEEGHRAMAWAHLDELAALNAQKYPSIPVGTLE